MSRTFRLRPRYRALALSAIGVGGTLGTTAVALLGGALLPLGTGVAGVALGAAYLLSPSWKLEVVVDDDGFAVRSPTAERFRVAWADVVTVFASPASRTCFVDGGSPETSLIVPGDGAPAPYDIEDKPALYAWIVEHVARDKIREVESLEAARREATRAS